MKMNRSVPGIFCAVALAVFASNAMAGQVDMAGGWRASWDSSLDGFVDIQSNGVAGGATLFQKSAEFREGPTAGVFPGIEIVFTQIAANAVSTLVIQDEIITNSTGQDWTDFHMEVSGSGSHFDPAATLVSGGPPPVGFTITPFQQANFANGDTLFNIFDGIVANGSQWFPGDTASDGNLFIRVTTGDGVNTPFAQFTLTETPTPEPATIALLGFGVAAMARRRR